MIDMLFDGLFWGLLIICYLVLAIVLWGLLQFVWYTFLKVGTFAVLNAIKEFRKKENENEQKKT